MRAYVARWRGGVPACEVDEYAGAFDESDIASAPGDWMAEHLRTWVFPTLTGQIRMTDLPASSHRNAARSRSMAAGSLGLTVRSKSS